MCDAMAHMNVRHYMAMFDDASFQLLGRLSGAEKDGTAGWADVRHEIEYKRETRAGTLVTIRSQLLRVGRSSVTYRHLMTESPEGEVHAQATFVSVRFDLTARAPLEIDAETRRRAEALV
jgi:acyl-CoA thioester hydrolase